MSLNVEQFRAATSEYASAHAEAITETLTEALALAREGEPARSIVALYELLRASRALATAVDDVAEAIAGAGVTLPANWRNATTLEEMIAGARGIHPAADALEDLIDFAKAGAPN